MRCARRAPADRLRSAAAGLSAAVVGVGVAELVAAIVEPAASPFAVIGGGLIDLAPAWAKDTAIALFGTGDKIALITGIALVLAVVAARRGAPGAASVGSRRDDPGRPRCPRRRRRDDPSRRRAVRVAARHRRGRRGGDRAASAHPCGCDRSPGSVLTAWIGGDSWSGRLARQPSASRPSSWATSRAARPARSTRSGRRCSCRRRPVRRRPSRQVRNWTSRVSLPS